MKFKALQVAALLIASAHAEMPCSVMDDIMGRCGLPKYGVDLKATIDSHVVQVSCYRDSKISYLVGRRGEYAEYHEVTKKASDAMPEIPPNLGAMEWGPGKVKLPKLETFMAKAKALADKAPDDENS